MAHLLILGERHSKLTAVRAISELLQDGRRSALWVCECGTERAAPIGRVRAGTITSCGCDGIERIRMARTIHGMHGTPEYSSWQSMKGRCLCRTDKDYPRWGGRGISVCQEWIESFEAFYRHIGPRPAGTTLDRIDSKKGYEPGNVRWATHVEQACNRTTSYIWRIRGLTFDSAQDAADHFTVSDMTIHRWAKGFFDKRRDSFTSPRKDCHVDPRY